MLLLINVNFDNIFYYFIFSIFAGQHLILETDPEKGSEYVFDNPGFKGNWTYEISLIQSIVILR